MKRLIARCLGRGRWGGMEGGTVALGWLCWFLGRDRKERCRGRKGLQFRQGGDWLMWDPLALLTGHVWSLTSLLIYGRSMHTLGEECSFPTPQYVRMSITICPALVTSTYFTHEQYVL